MATRASAAPVARREVPASLTVYPRWAFAGGSVWITCYVPESYGQGWIRFGLEGHSFRGPMAIERIENKVLVERVDCGAWVASCELQTARGVERLTAQLEVKGGVCDGGNR